MQKRRVLLLAGDARLNSALTELLGLDGIQVTEATSNDAASRGQVDLVIAACDSWPEPWTLRMLRATFHRVTCLLLSGSPMSGPYAAAGFRRGYFLALPVSGRRILELVRTLLQ